MVPTMPTTASWGAVGELAASRHGVTSRSQAAQHGISRTSVAQLLRRGYLIEPAPGVLVVVGSAPTWHQQITIATSAGRASAVAAFRTAAALHGMDGYECSDSEPIELLATSHRRVALPGIVVHRGPIQPSDLHTVNSITCTSVARTLCDLGSIDPVHRVRMAFEWAWRNNYSLDWLQRTADRLHRPGQRGTGVLQKLLVDARLHERPTESALEVRLECILEGIPGLVRQHSIHRADGSLVARTDFAIPAVRLALEAHSKRFHFGPTTDAHDAQRDTALVAQGWYTYYVTNQAMNNPAALRATVRRLISQRADSNSDAAA